jgi:acyl carrier protein
VLETVLACLVRALKVDAASASEINEHTTASDLAGWTSVAHLSLVLELEKTFGVTFENEEVVSMGSVSAILDRLKAKGASGPVRGCIQK